MLSVNKVLDTDGSGYWSTVRESVTVTGLELAYCNEEADFGELRVYFDTRTWDVDDYGLIYTDRLFLKELKEFLNSTGIAGADVEYSEQGMQGDDYVSLDVGAEFIESFTQKAQVSAAG